MTSLTFTAKNFEGPLDLLLVLVTKNRMSLFDIDILSLIDQYLSIIVQLQEYKLEVASEFIEMAARLVLLKSVHLLPTSEEGEKLREELQGQLIEYALCKRVAVQLGFLSRGIKHIVREPVKMQFCTMYKKRHSVYELINAYKNAMGKNLGRSTPTEEQFEPLVAKPIVSVSSRIRFVIEGIGNSIKSLKDCFFKETDKSGIVATFLAVLELLHNGRIAIHKDGMIKVLQEEKKEQSGEFKAV